MSRFNVARPGEIHMSNTCLKLSDVLAEELSHIAKYRESRLDNPDLFKAPKPPSRLRRLVLWELADVFSILRSWLRLLVPEKEEQVAKQSQPSGTEQEREKLNELVKQLHEANHAALCLSGGGIRSATFNLGILQGLAQSGLLSRFHYLSTVSGGGFVGAWLSAWIHRSALREAVEPVSKLTEPVPDKPTEPELKPVKALRRYSNYLSPKVGLLSADTWTLAAIYARNLFLTSLVFVPFIFAVLVLPRLMYALVQVDPAQIPFGGFVVTAVFVSGALTAFTGVVFVGQNLPSIGLKNDDERMYLWRCLSLLVASSVLLTVFWSWFIRSDRQLLGEFALFQFAWLTSPWGFSGFALLLVLGPWFVCAWQFNKSRQDDVAMDGVNLAGGTLLIAIAGIITGLLVHLAVANPAITDTRVYTTLALPFLMLAIMLGGTLISGFTSRLTKTQDEEWWARCGAWMGIVAASWIVLSVIVLWIPEPILLLCRDLVRDPYHAVSSWPNRFRAIAGAAGVLSTMLALFSGFSSKTPGTQLAKTRAGAYGQWTTLATSVLSTVALVFLLASFAALTSPLLKVLSGTIPIVTRSAINAEWWEHSAILMNSSFRSVLFAGFVLLFAGGLLGLFIDMNKFTLHYYYRNRFSRAYLRASRNLKKDGKSTLNLFTDFDPADNFPMSELQGQLPLHVINIALNLTGSTKLEWQERKAESFTISPLHCGSYWLGYRKSEEYGGPVGGITLASAVAISGAAVSPDMGYMMSSPVVRLLMALFNIRLGRWMGNPGPQGDKTYRLHSPRHMIRPTIAEALGLTDERSPYVYLSDGGHFENLGVYEMVMRRCRTIVVSDASTDPDYEFESLAQAIRKVRIDFGIPIEFEKFSIIGRTTDGSGSYCALGKICYSHVDKGCPDGDLIYIKPALHGDEPRDIINYQHEFQTFPQDPISDQFFTESQFESYRALGQHIVSKLAGPQRLAGFDDLRERIQRTFVMAH
ncbi:MAG: hypothetical protein DMG12_13875 [Acidobacteria bacterium]|nr:MAG: hypothetical protein DMG12_13875 [Acidobacteriota bacterium]